jgi:hypothetical protein
MTFGSDTKLNNYLFSKLLIELIETAENQNKIITIQHILQCIYIEREIKHCGGDWLVVLDIYIYIYLNCFGYIFVYFLNLFSSSWF